jgi:hypothetical protein
MNPTEITKHLPETVNVGSLAAANTPFTAVVRRMLGPAADELAEMSRDQVRVYRYGRQMKLLQKVERLANAAGFTPQPVPPKILFPLLEGASLEDDEKLHDTWAALLANAASPDHPEKVRPRFIAILRQMSPDEMDTLKLVANTTDEASNCRAVELESDGQMIRTQPIRTHCLEKRSVPRPGENAICHYRRLHVCLQILATAGLVEIREGTTTLMPLGNAFLRVCRPPKAGA